MENALKCEEIANFVYAWYRGFNDHAPADEMTQFLASDGFELVFPEATLCDYDEFVGWLKRVNDIFFDAMHIVKKLEININGGKAELVLVVHWKAHTWQPPEPYSELLSFEAHQRWLVQHDEKLDRLVIKKYIVERLLPLTNGHTDDYHGLGKVDD